ncbi:hypothetical protein RND71_009907 [Anisodus tanguticus]|uniref:MBD domain-containing protein n=1 Tax=Anisodus tanguticus TaxID=243964 RepID=A0AAE1VIM1_9SOLA|nr:hypothetical protein RND71_009907 [Anisodus tanguticus]
MVAPPTTTTITPYTSVSSFKLPPDWGVEEVPRSNSCHVDKYYYEPETGLKYRSLREVERRLNGEIFALRTRASAVRNYPKASSSLSRKMVIYGGKNSDQSSLLSAPAKVNWVLSSPKGDAWNPFIAGTPIPDSVKQQWTKRFMLFMNDETLNAENSN